MNPIVWAIWSLNIIQDCSSNMSSSSSKMVISRWGFAIFSSCSIYLHKVHVLNLNATFKCSFAIHYNLTNVTIISIDCADAKCATSPALDATWTGNWKSKYQNLGIIMTFSPFSLFCSFANSLTEDKVKTFKEMFQMFDKVCACPNHPYIHIWYLESVSTNAIYIIFDVFSQFTFEPNMIYIRWSLGNSFSSTYVVENRKQEGQVFLTLGGSSVVFALCLLIEKNSL